MRLNTDKFFSKMKSSLFLVLVLILSTVVPPTYSKYHSSINSTGSREIGKFVLLGNLVEDETINLHSLKPGDTLTFPLIITNFNDYETSEVGINYKMHIERTNYLPVTFTLTEENNSTNLLNVNLESGTLFLPAGVNTTHEYVITVNWNTEYNDYRYSNTTGYIKLVIEAEQVEPL